LWGSVVSYLSRHWRGLWLCAFVWAGLGGLGVSYRRICTAVSGVCEFGEKGIYVLRVCSPLNRDVDMGDPQSSDISHAKWTFVAKTMGQSLPIFLETAHRPLRCPMRTLKLRLNSGIVLIRDVTTTAKHQIASSSESTSHSHCHQRPIRPCLSSHCVELNGSIATPQPPGPQPSVLEPQSNHKREPSIDFLLHYLPTDVSMPSDQNRDSALPAEGGAEPRNRYYPDRSATDNAFTKLSILHRT
jgi:hypothetical protein